MDGELLEIILTTVLEFELFYPIDKLMFVIFMEIIVTGIDFNFCHSL